MRICLRGECKLTGENGVCCLECSKASICKELGRCTEDNIDYVDLNKCSKIVNKEL